MKPGGKSVAAWIAVLVPLWVVLILCTAWEPVMRDGWGHWKRHHYIPLSLHSIYEYARASYVHNNPRLGQTVTYLMFTPGPWHSIATPLIELGVFYLLTALVLGRRPSFRDGQDALLFLTIVAIVLVSAPSIGPMLFYRPFTGNYVFGFLLNLLWLVPYRFHAAEPRPHNLAWVPLMLVLGFASGVANEHTGPALAVMGVFALVVFARRGERFVPWAIAGLVGLVAGGLALFFAPGQEFRYHGIAVRQSTLERIVERGVGSNVKIVILLALYLLPALAWVALGIIGRVRRASVGQPRERALGQLVIGVLAVLVVLTLLASPKQGARLHFAPVCLGAASIAGWALAQAGRAERIVAAVGSALVVALVSIRLLVAYHTSHGEFTQRMAMIQSAAPGSVVTVPHYSQDRTRWILGDDFELASLRANIAAVFGLGAIELPTGSAEARDSDEP